MNEERLCALLEKVVETNQTVIAQNERFLGFLEKRDEGVPERTTLEIQRLKYEVERCDREIRILAQLGLTPDERMKEFIEHDRASTLPLRKLAKEFLERK